MLSAIYMRTEGAERGAGGDVCAAARSEPRNDGGGGARELEREREGPGDMASWSDPLKGRPTMRGHDRDGI